MLSRAGPKNPYRGGPKRSLKDINCEFCKTSFRPKGSSIKFCSSKCSGKGLTRRAILRLFQFIVIDPKTKCWIWQKKSGSGGYAQLTIRNKKFGKTVHRALYIILVGDVPKGFQLDHLCRNRLCVNPKHLEPVLPVENIRRGSSSKMNLDSVRKILKLYQNNVKQIDIAKEFSIHQSEVSRIINGKRWKI